MSDEEKKEVITSRELQISYQKSGGLVELLKAAELIESQSADIAELVELAKQTRSLDEILNQDFRNRLDMAIAKHSGGGEE